MTVFLLITAGVLGVTLLLALVAAVAVWARTARARRRAQNSRLAEAAETIPERNNALGTTRRHQAIPPTSGQHDD